MIINTIPVDGIVSTCSILPIVHTGVYAVHTALLQWDIFQYILYSRNLEPLTVTKSY
jgi:hypothetical protein